MAKFANNPVLFLEAMAESIAKLGYFFQTIFSMLLLAILYEALLLNSPEDANEERWLSVSSFLRALAEAAPDEFLNAVQKQFA